MKTKAKTINHIIFEICLFSILSYIIFVLLKYVFLFSNFSRVNGNMFDYGNYSKSSFYLVYELLNFANYIIAIIFALYLRNKYQELIKTNALKRKRILQVCLIVVILCFITPLYGKFLFILSPIERALGVHTYEGIPPLKTVIWSGIVHWRIIVSLFTNIFIVFVGSIKKKSKAT